MNKILQGLKICYFGHYDPNYSRNRILLKALRRLGTEVIEVVNTQTFITRSSLMTLQALQTDFDLIWIGFPGHTDVPLAKLISLVKGKPLIFDAFISLWDSNIFDRQTYQIYGLNSLKYFFIDKLASQLADLIVVDTKTHADYFAKVFSISQTKFFQIWVGADDEIMYPRPAILSEKKFTVFFYGSFIPLQGIEYIIDAAKILHERAEPVEFLIVGCGQTYRDVRTKSDSLGINNINFLGKMPYTDLPNLMSQSHVCLGIFGTTPKAKRVIPNKVFDALAVRKPVISGDTPAIRECLTHSKNAWLCPVGDGKALAEAILTLKHDQSLRERIAENGYQYFKSHFSIDAIAQDLTLVIEKVLNHERKSRF